MTYDEFKVVVAKVIEIEYDHWLKHGTPIRKEDAVLVADDVAGEVFIDSAVELARLRAEIDRLRGVLKTIAAYRLDDFAGPCTMAMQCVQDAKDALGGAADQPSPAPRLTPEEQAVLDACEVRFRRVMVDFGYERVVDVPDDAVSWKPDAQALLSATRDWLLERAADNGTEGHMEKRNAD